MINKIEFIKKIKTIETERQFDQIFGRLPNVQMLAFENGRFPGAAEDWRKEEFLGGGDTFTAPSNYLTIDAKGKVACCVTVMVYGGNADYTP